MKVLLSETPPEKGAEAGSVPPMLVERVPTHYAPTAALAIGDQRAFRPVKHTAIVANELAVAEAKGDAGEGVQLAPLEDAVAGPVRLTPPLQQPGFLFVPLVDQLVVLDDVEVNRNDPFGWSPLPKSRGKNADSLAAWMGLTDRSFAGVRRWLLALREDVGIPHTLAGLGLRPEHASEFASQAFNDPSTSGNPRRMTERDFERLYGNCIEGRLEPATD